MVDKKINSSCRPFFVYSQKSMLREELKTQTLGDQRKKPIKKIGREALNPKGE